MRKSIVLLVLLAAIPFLAAARASATDKNQAQQACSKNPNCSAFHGKGGDLQIQVKTSEGLREIYCPAQGACQCIMCKTTGKSGGPKADAGGVLTGTADKARLAANPGRRNDAAPKASTRISDSRAPTGSDAVQPKSPDKGSGGSTVPKSNAGGSLSRSSGRH